MNQTQYSEVFTSTIVDVISHTKTEGKPVKEISFAVENIVNPDTYETERVSRCSFVREVYDKDMKPLTEVDLLALRGHRVEVYVYPDYWVIEAVD